MQSLLTVVTTGLAFIVSTKAYAADGEPPASPEVAAAIQPYLDQHKLAGVPTTTSVENDCARVPCRGGTPTPVSGAPGASAATGQVMG